MALGVTRNFGSWRGAVRLALAHGEVLTGAASVVAPPPGSVRRLVFVCHGNICRSAFAEALARRAGHAGAASFGLSTSTGKPAWPAVCEQAQARGLDLAGHRTTDITDFEPQDGDYLLAMEVRHLRKLAANPKVSHLPRGLLGSFARPPWPHLHDPYMLDESYMTTCLDRIEDSVGRLIKAFPVSPARS